MEPSRLIKIVSDGTGPGTHVYNHEGVELENVYEVGVVWKVDDLPKATLKAYGVNGEMQAELVALEKKLVPPPRPTDSVQLRVGPPQWHWLRKRCPYILTRYTPLNTWGTKTQILAKGWMDARHGPMTLERMLHT